MYIGASPGSTGGGIKTSTFTLLILWVKELFLGRYGSDINFSKKRIPVEQAFRALLIVFLSITCIIISFLIIMLLDNPDPIALFFEVVSAFGTVGLSTGSKIDLACSLSCDLSWISKIIIMLLMIGGRVGLITLASALLKPHKLECTFPEESIVIG
jgi:trk system potassium uptake protein TrkH